MPGLADFTGADRRRSVSPSITDVRQDRSHLIVVQDPIELRHGGAGWRPIRRSTARATQYNVQKCSRFVLLNGGRSAERREQSGRSFSVRCVTARTFVGVDGSAYSVRDRHVIEEDQEEQRA